MAVAFLSLDLCGAAANQTGFTGITRSAGVVLLLHSSSLCTSVTVSVFMPGLVMPRQLLCLIRGWTWSCSLEQVDLLVDLCLCLRGMSTITSMSITIITIITTIITILPDCSCSKRKTQLRMRFLGDDPENIAHAHTIFFYNSLIGSNV